MGRQLAPWGRRLGGIGAAAFTTLLAWWFGSRGFDYLPSAGLCVLALLLILHWYGVPALPARWARTLAGMFSGGSILFVLVIVITYSVTAYIPNAQPICDPADMRALGWPFRFAVLATPNVRYCVGQGPLILPYTMVVFFNRLSLLLDLGACLVVAYLIRRREDQHTRPMTDGSFLGLSGRWLYPLVLLALLATAGLLAGPFFVIMGELCVVVGLWIYLVYRSRSRVRWIGTLLGGALLVAQLLILVGHLHLLAFIPGIDPAWLEYGPFHNSDIEYFGSGGAGPIRDAIDVTMGVPQTWLRLEGTPTSGGQRPWVHAEQRKQGGLTWFYIRNWNPVALLIDLGWALLGVGVLGVGGRLIRRAGWARRAPALRRVVIR